MSATTVWVRKSNDSNLKDLDAEALELKNFCGTITAILNKITPENFKEMSVQILQQEFNSRERLNLAADHIYEKAVLEPIYSQTYANLCKIMSSICLPEEKDPKVSPFQMILLNRLQDEFFRKKTEDDNINMEIAEIRNKLSLSDTQRSEQIFELQCKQKKKLLGCINFIGELFNLTMISKRIMHVQCVGDLLNRKDPATGGLAEEAIECLSKLYSTAGKKLEEDCDTDEKRSMFNRNFNEYKGSISDKEYSARIRFMILDVVELRENDWVPRREEVRPQRIKNFYREHRHLYREETKIR